MSILDSSDAMSGFEASQMDSGFVGKGFPVSQQFLHVFWTYSYDFFSGLEINDPDLNSKVHNDFGYELQRVMSLRDEEYLSSMRGLRLDNLRSWCIYSCQGAGLRHKKEGFVLVTADWSGVVGDSEAEGRIRALTWILYPSSSRETWK